MILKKILNIFLVLSIFNFCIFAKISRLKKEGTISIKSDLQNKTQEQKLLNNNINNIEYKYVIFDISNCFWEKTLYEVLMSLKKKIKFPVSGYLDLLGCGVSYAMGNLDAKKGYETLFKHMNKMSQEQVKEKCNLIWEQDCKNYIYKDADRLFNEYKNKGLKLILVDAGISELYQEFLKIYKFDYVLVANLEYKDGKSTGKLTGEPSSGIYKYNMVKKLIEQDLHGSLDQAIFYANSHNDIPLLEHVGKPMPVNPNKKLEKFAKQKKWPILTFKELKI